MIKISGMPFSPKISFNSVITSCAKAIELMDDRKFAEIVNN